MPSRNVEMIAVVARQLADLREEVVFLGGATVELYMTRSGLPPARVTKDVDVIVEVATQAKYYAVAEHLRRLGFHEDVDALILCRWRVSDIIVDVMPTEPSILGFSNQWYKHAFLTARPFLIEAGLEIRLATAPSFIATKREAFLGRGGGDFVLSHDLEDIISVLVGRVELLDEVKAAAPELRRYLSQQFGA